MTLKDISYKAYQKIDDSLMYLARKGTSAWNWTTGMTKVDLANTILTTGAVLESTGFILAYNPLTFVAVPIILICTNSVQKANKKLERLEIEAADKQALHPAVEANKEICETMGPAILASSAINYDLSYTFFSHSPPAYDGGVITFSLATYYLAISASFYVMRTDYLPPRKDFVIRAKEKLEKLVQDYKERAKAPIPVPVPVTTRY